MTLSLHFTRTPTGDVSLRPEGVAVATYPALRRALEEIRFDRALGVPVADPERVSQALAAARREGIDVGMDARIRSGLLTEVPSVDRWLDLSSVLDRVRAIDKTSGRTVRPYQRTGIMWLALRDRAILADEPGCGKTLQAIAALPPNAPCLVVTVPISRGDWRGELRVCRPNGRVTMLEGRDSFRWPLPGETVLTHWYILPDHHVETCSGDLPRVACPGCADDIVFEGATAVVRRKGHLAACDGFLEPDPCPGCAPFLERAPPGLVLIGDEIHFAKNEDALRSQRFVALSTAALHADRGRVWTISGTPVTNDEGELWTILQATGNLGEHIYGDEDAFRESFVVEGENEEDIARQVISRGSLALRGHMMRRLKRHVLPELPDKVYRRHVIELDQRSLEACEALLRRMRIGMDDLVELLIREDKSIPLGLISSMRAALAAAKIPAMLGIVQSFEEKKEPTLVFSAHRSPIELLARRAGWGAIMGGEKEAHRRALVDAFQREGSKMPGLGLTIGAGGLSLTLTRASQVLMVNRGWTPPENLQAEDRAHRFGQDKVVAVTDIVGDHPLEHRLYELLMQKQRTIAATVDAAARIGEGGESKAARELVKRIEALEKAVVEGRAKVRGPEGDAERAARAVLFRAAFASGSDERMALSLLQAEGLIGLSNEQWALASEIAGRSILVGVESAAALGRGNERPA